VIGGSEKLQWIGDTVSVNPNYQGRAELSLPDVSLRLKSVTVTDSGNYTVSLTSVSGDSKSATVTLKVKEKITSVTVTQNIPNPIEYTDTVTLTCDVKGTVESRLWFKDERALHSNDRITISQDNATLTIISVTRNDGGTYRCEAKNSFSSVSGSHTLSIAYSVGAQDQSATIAAITLGVILFVIIILLIAVVYRKRRHSAGDPGISSTRNEARTIYQNESSHMGNQDNEVPDRPYESIGPQSSEDSNLTGMFEEYSPELTEERKWCIIVGQSQDSQTEIPSFVTKVSIDSSQHPFPKANSISIQPNTKHSSLCVTDVWFSFALCEINHFAAPNVYENRNNVQRAKNKVSKTIVGEH
ncbi:carcinoembryonic antigen-related cell adhesion molecule 1-like, partial [Callorhinchus milii]|uniref:carcinoembryonic antigen-related cell adhesion molecule 1-like n=1 Tax=Callorhinchus milii TaxID=7868 RepID=UPI001C3FA86A